MKVAGGSNNSDDTNDLIVSSKVNLFTDQSSSSDSSMTTSSDAIYTLIKNTQPTLLIVFLSSTPEMFTVEFYSDFEVLIRAVINVLSAVRSALRYSAPDSIG